MLWSPARGGQGLGWDKVGLMEKVIIIGVIVNLGTLIVLFWFLNRIQKIMQEHPSPKQEEENEDDDSWHSWRFWLPPEDEPHKQDQDKKEEDSVQKGHSNLPEERDQTGREGEGIKTGQNDEEETSSDEAGQPPQVDPDS